MSQNCLAVTAVAVVAALSADLRAETSVLSPLKDNTLFQSATGALSSGAGQFLFAGANSQGAVRRGLIAFDIAGAIPAGATITGASLRLHLSQTNAAETAVSLHRVLADWGEGASNAGTGGGGAAAPGDATWIHRFLPSVTWAAAGGDFAAVPTTTRLVDGVGAYTWTGLGAEVQAWLSSPGTNFGWVVRGDEGTAGSAMRFDSRENVMAANRPELIIEYVIPSPASAAMLVVGGLLTAGRRRRAPSV